MVCVQKPPTNKRPRMVSFSQQQRPSKCGVIGMINSQDIEQICRQQQHRWRPNKLSPGPTVKHFGWQILMGNVSCDDVKHHGDGEFTASAFCQARQRLPLAVLQSLSQRIAQAALQKSNMDQQHLWLGHRVFRIDGSSMSLPDSDEVREYFGC